VHYRFGVFEFESGSGELHKSGRPIPLEPQPSRALGVLLARADQLVTRDELKDAVWGKDTHVDFDRGLAYCISQIRTALGDAGDSPRFIQTVPKKGYRFIAPVHAPAPVSETPDVLEGNHSKAERLRPAAWFGQWSYLAMLAALLLGVGVVAGVALRGPAETPARVVVAVSIFDNETGLAEYDRLVSGLSDIVVTRLTELAPDRVAVIGNAAVLRKPRNIRNLKALATGVRADYVLLGQLQHADSGLRFITHFIRLSDETHLRANRLSFPNGDLTSLEQTVVTEFERAVQQHVLSDN
jgi:DNA-binding winged helix-turn-helix (wHTH) protein/TolB-like protein